MNLVNGVGAIAFTLIPRRIQSDGSHVSRRSDPIECPVRPSSLASKIAPQGVLDVLTAVAWTVVVEEAKVAGVLKRPGFLVGRGQHRELKPPYFAIAAAVGVPDGYG